VLSVGVFDAHSAASNWSVSEDCESDVLLGERRDGVEGVAAHGDRQVRLMLTPSHAAKPTAA
jgi:hypothetical protein